MTDTCASFLRTLLEKCIGTVMIEWEQWNFSEPSFDRGYLNDRLKKSIPVNALTRKRLTRLFEAVLRPGDRAGRFQEPQAAEAANAFIALAGERFQVDLSVWKTVIPGTTVSADPIFLPALVSYSLCWRGRKYCRRNLLRMH